MAYATQQDIIDRYGADAVEAVADRDGDGNIDSDAVSAALDDAQADVDSYIGVKYAVPLASPPMTVVRACVDIAMHYLAGDQATEKVELRMNVAMAWLRDISKGVAVLGNQPADMAPSRASFSADERMATRTKLAGGF